MASGTKRKHRSYGIQAWLRRTNIAKRQKEQKDRAAGIVQPAAPERPKQERVLVHNVEANQLIEKRVFDKTSNEMITVMVPSHAGVVTSTREQPDNLSQLLGDQYCMDKGVGYGAMTGSTSNMGARNKICVNYDQSGVAIYRERGTGLFITAHSILSKANNAAALQIVDEAIERVHCPKDTSSEKGEEPLYHVVKGHKNDAEGILMKRVTVTKGKGKHVVVDKPLVVDLTTSKLIPFDSLQHKHGLPLLRSWQYRCKDADGKLHMVAVDGKTARFIQEDGITLDESGKLVLDSVNGEIVTIKGMGDKRVPMAFCQWLQKASNSVNLMSLTKLLKGQIRMGKKNKASLPTMKDDLHTRVITEPSMATLEELLTASVYDYVSAINDGALPLEKGIEDIAKQCEEFAGKWMDKVFANKIIKMHADVLANGEGQYENYPNGKNGTIHANLATGMGKDGIGKELIEQIKGTLCAIMAKVLRMTHPLVSLDEHKDLLPCELVEEDGKKVIKSEDSVYQMVAKMVNPTKEAVNDALEKLGADWKARVMRQKIVANVEVHGKICNGGDKTVGTLGMQTIVAAPLNNTASSVKNEETYFVDCAIRETGCLCHDNENIEAVPDEIDADWTLPLQIEAALVGVTESLKDQQVELRYYPPEDADRARVLQAIRDKFTQVLSAEDLVLVAVDRGSDGATIVENGAMKPLYNGGNYVLETDKKTGLYLRPRNIQGIPISKDDPKINDMVYELNGTKYIRAKFVLATGVEPVAEGGPNPQDSTELHPVGDVPVTEIRLMKAPEKFLVRTGVPASSSTPMPDEIVEELRNSGHAILTNAKDLTIHQQQDLTEIISYAKRELNKDGRVIKTADGVSLVDPVFIAKITQGAGLLLKERADFYISEYKNEIRNGGSIHTLLGQDLTDKDWDKLPEDKKNRIINLTEIHRTLMQGLQLRNRGGLKTFAIMCEINRYLHCENLGLQAGADDWVNMVVFSDAMKMDWTGENELVRDAPWIYNGLAVTHVAKHKRHGFVNSTGILFDTLPNLPADAVNPIVDFYDSFIEQALSNNPAKAQKALLNLLKIYGDCEEFSDADGIIKAEEIRDAFAKLSMVAKVAPKLMFDGWKAAETVQQLHSFLSKMVGAKMPLPGAYSYMSCDPFALILQLTDPNSEYHNYFKLKITASNNAKDEATVRDQMQRWVLKSGEYHFYGTSAKALILRYPASASYQAKIVSPVGEKAMATRTHDTGFSDFDEYAIIDSLFVFNMIDCIYEDMSNADFDGDAVCAILYEDRGSFKKEYLDGLFNTAAAWKENMHTLDTADEQKSGGNHPILLPAVPPPSLAVPFTEEGAIKYIAHRLLNTSPIGIVNDLYSRILEVWSHITNIQKFGDMVMEAAQRKAEQDEALKNGKPITGDPAELVSSTIIDLTQSETLKNLTKSTGLKGLLVGETDDGTWNPENGWTLIKMDDTPDGTLAEGVAITNNEGISYIDNIWALPPNLYTLIFGTKAQRMGKEPMEPFKIVKYYGVPNGSKPLPQNSRTSRQTKATKTQARDIYAIVTSLPVEVLNSHKFCEKQMAIGVYSFETTTSMKGHPKNEFMKLARLLRMNLEYLDYIQCMVIDAMKTGWNFYAKEIQEQINSMRISTTPLGMFARRLMKGKYGEITLKELDDTLKTMRERYEQSLQYDCPTRSQIMVAYTASNAVAFKMGKAWAQKIDGQTREERLQKLGKSNWDFSNLLYTLFDPCERPMLHKTTTEVQKVYRQYGAESHKIFELYERHRISKQECDDLFDMLVEQIEQKIEALIDDLHSKDGSDYSRMRVAMWVAAAKYWCTHRIADTDNTAPKSPKFAWLLPWYLLSLFATSETRQHLIPLDDVFDIQSYEEQKTKGLPKLQKGTTIVFLNQIFENEEDYKKYPTKVFVVVNPQKFAQYDVNELDYDCSKTPFKLDAQDSNVAKGLVYIGDCISRNGGARLRTQTVEIEDAIGKSSCVYVYAMPERIGYVPESVQGPSVSERTTTVKHVTIVFRSKEAAEKFGKGIAKGDSVLVGFSGASDRAYAITEGCLPQPPDEFFMEDAEFEVPAGSGEVLFTKQENMGANINPLLYHNQLLGAYWEVVEQEMSESKRQDLANKLQVDPEACQEFTLPDQVTPICYEHGNGTWVFRNLEVKFVATTTSQG